MTGPEHYRSAEKILEALGQITKDNGGVPAVLATGLLAEAQVHATLALAAATAGQTAVIAARDDIGDLDSDTWYEVSGTKAETGLNAGADDE